jgi:hypothetical protein
VARDLPQAGYDVKLATLLSWSAVTALAGTVLVSSTFAADTLTVRFRSCIHAPCDLFIEALVERDARNRRVDFIIESDSYSASSHKDLDGEHAPRTNSVVFRGLPAGQYALSVSVRGSDGERDAVYRNFVVW